MNTARPLKKQGNKRRRIGILEYGKVGINEVGHYPSFQSSIIPLFLFSRLSFPRMISPVNLLESGAVNMGIDLRR